MRDDHKRPDPKRSCVDPKRGPGAVVEVSVGSPLTGAALTSAISAAMAGLYGDFYGHDRTTATTFIDGNIVVCVLDDILTSSESRLVEFGGAPAVTNGRVAFQSHTEDRFTAAIESLTRRRVVAFLGANQTSPGCACELFCLDHDPVTDALSGAA